MKVDFSPQNGKRFDQMIQPARPSFWNRWGTTLALVGVGLALIVVSSIWHALEPLSKPGVYCLAGGIVLWLLSRGSKR
jgi:hypothetical protein